MIMLLGSARVLHLISLFVVHSINEPISLRTPPLSFVKDYFQYRLLKEHGRDSL